MNKVMSQSIARTNTPQEYFAHVGSLESQAAIAYIARQMLDHEQSGLKQSCIDPTKEELLRSFLYYLIIVKRRQERNGLD